MKSKYILLMLGWMSLAGCKNLTCDFSYSPTAPRAGESVSFTNQSSGADDYEWNFGDNVTATMAGPTHIYKKPGTYTVRLTVIRNKVEKRTRTHHITVLDTVPVIVASTDSLLVYQPVTFSANIYNPWKKELAYQWHIEGDAVILGGSGMDSAALTCYFTQPNTEAKISLQLTMGEATTPLTLTMPVRAHQAPSVLYSQDGTNYEQRWYTMGGQRVYQNPVITQDAEAQRLLDAEQDSVFQYGSIRLTVAQVREWFGQPIQGFQVDKMMNKIYAYGNGLWVCNINGEYPQQLVTGTVLCIKMDGAGNRIYWAAADGLYSHLPVTTRDNKMPFAPQHINTTADIQRLSINSNQH